MAYYDHQEELEEGEHGEYEQPSMGHPETRGAEDGVRGRGEWRRSRLLALVAVCLMSVGSHFGTYLLGPLKSRLHREMGTSNSQFSLLIASFNLNSTWTPLLGGLFVSRFGTTWSSIATTGCVLLGQLILLVGVTTSHLFIMSLGLFIFGLGLTPLAVVQETLVSHLSASHHLGISLALGLVSGKSSSFISSIISLPLADRFGDAVPFSVAVALCSCSFGMNWARLARGWGRDMGEARVKEKRKVEWLGMDVFGDVYWVYILLNLLAGSIWQPFLHLSANLIQHRYGVSEQVASNQASVLLAGAIILYPIIGHMTDRFDPSSPRTTFYLIITSSILTLLCYTYLCLPPSSTGTPWPGMVLFALGHGSATLLLVILIPRILPPHLVPLGLGVHKSMEMAASSLSQTLSGVWLDYAKGQDPTEGSGGGGLLRTFWTINVIQLACAIVLWRFDMWKRRRIALDAATQEYVAISTFDTEARDEDVESPRPKLSRAISIKTAEAIGPGEKSRSILFFSCCIGLVVVVWAAFLGVAWHDL